MFSSRMFIPGKHCPFLRVTISGEKLLAQLERFARCRKTNVAGKMLGKIFKRLSQRKVFENHSPPHSHSPVQPSAFSLCRAPDVDSAGRRRRACEINNTQEREHFCPRKCASKGSPKGRSDNRQSGLHRDAALDCGELEDGYQTRVSQAVSKIESSRVRGVIEMKMKLTEEMN